MTPADFERCVQPQRPSDDLDFEALAQAYNFETISNRSRVFTRLAIKECRKRTRPLNVLDIGCGKGIELIVDYQWAIRQHVDEYWGLEPDATIKSVPGLFDHYLPHVMEDADLPRSHFDLVYSFMVMEHVSDPDRFVQSLYRCLKPGGTYLFATPNQRHYFARIAKTLHRFGLDEFVLRKTLGKAAEDDHYPLQYRFNNERTIRRLAATMGFEQPEFVYLEELGPIGYFPKGLRFIFHALAAKRRFIRNPKSLITMVCRIRKPVSESDAH